MHTEKKPPSEIDCAIAQKVAALSNGATLGLPTGGVMGLETDMSFVFLAGDRAYKLKKAVRLPYLDFSTIEGLPPGIVSQSKAGAGVYLAVCPLRAVDQDMVISGTKGRVVD